MNEQAEAFCVVGRSDCYSKSRLMFFAKAASRVVDLCGAVRPHVTRARHEKRIPNLHAKKGVLRERLRLFAFQDFELHGALVKG
jgi:hypothetical protein